MPALNPRLFRALVFVFLAAFPLGAQTVAPSSLPWARNVVIPQCRAFALTGRHSVQITGVDARVAILEQVATTTIDVSLSNPSPSRLEAELVVPVPRGAVVRGFTFQGPGVRPSAQLLPKDEATAFYESIVRQVRDPALMEFVGYNLIRSSVFPVEPGGTQKVRLTYEHLLPADDRRIDYVIPRSESLACSIPWTVSVSIKARQPISTVYSPSHQLETLRTDDRSLTIQLAETARTQPGSFRLSYLLAGEDVTASLFTYPDAKVGGGYFLLLGGLPTRPSREEDDRPVMRRSVTLVLDRSGSMAGEKLEQAREAALQVLGALGNGEAFNIVLYDARIEVYSPTPVVKGPQTYQSARAYLKGVRSGGGTNIHGALGQALEIEPRAGFLPLVLFLTDGLPTVGQTSETAIRRLAKEGNPHQQRIFTFGVGVDVNTPLLEGIAADSRGATTFVLPGEDVEVKVAQVFRRLEGPVLAAPVLRAVDGEGRSVPGRVRDLFPERLPDLFEGDQLVVLGQYVGNEVLRFEVAGDYLGKSRSFQFRFDPGKATVRNSFVPRLWASRKIATLIADIRKLGADHGVTTAGSHGAAISDPRLRELVDAVVRLSREFGVLTEYTAFLAREGTDLSKPSEVIETAARNFVDRAIGCRSGVASVNQTLNIVSQKNQACLNLRNDYLDANLGRADVTTVQQVSDRAFFRRGARWVDSRLIGDEDDGKPEKVIEFGSREFRELATRLAAHGRQGSISLEGDILLLVEGERVLVKGPKK